MRVKEFKIEAGGFEIAGKRWGREDGQPVLALHGWLDNAGSFDALAPLLGQEFQVAAVDLPGHGRSSWRGVEGSYHFIDWVDAVLRIGEALGWQEYSLLGHSMGAAISALVAPMSEGRVRRAVFLDGLGPWSLEAPDVVRQFRKALVQERLIEGRQGRRYESQEEMIEALGGPRRDLSAPKLRLLLARMVGQDEDGRWFFSYDRRLQAASRLRLTEEQVLAFLGAIDCPVLLVRPDQGWPMDKAMVKRRLAAIRDLEVVNVEGGHHVHLEAPDRVADAVREFLMGGGV